MKQDTKINPSFNWIESKSGGRGGRKGEGARVAIYKSGTYSNQLSVTLYEDTMKSIRWVAGDRVQVGFDLNTKCIALKRVPKNGYALTPTSVTGSKREKLIGKPATCVVKVSAPQDFEQVFNGPAEVSPDELIEIDGMLVLPFKAKK